MDKTDKKKMIHERSTKKRYFLRTADIKRKCSQLSLSLGYILLVNYNELEYAVHFDMRLVLQKENPLRAIISLTQKAFHPSS